ncbi:MAG TPA: hypothetical protein VF541_09315, partial [Longimicrobium sp.]
MARRGPGAVGNGGIVAYGARSPVWRLGAKHAQAIIVLPFSGLDDLISRRFTESRRVAELQGQVALV